MTTYLHIITSSLFIIHYSVVHAADSIIKYCEQTNTKSEVKCNIVLHILVQCLLSAGFSPVGGCWRWDLVTLLGGGGDAGSLT